MEALAKLAIYLTLGIGLIACNIWFVRAAYHGVTGGDLVVAPVKVIGGKGDAAVTGETLARMIISRLQSLEFDLEQSQSALRQHGSEKRQTANEGAASSTAVRPHGVTAGYLGVPKTVGLNAQLFEPTNIDVKVAGVDVGGLLPGIQRWFVADRTLAFTVSWEGETATIAGNIDALDIGKTRPVWLSVKDATANSIAEAVALALIHRRWAKNSAEFAELEDGEFRNLAATMIEVARINRRVVTYDESYKPEFEAVLQATIPLAKRTAGWTDLTAFIASIAEAAEDYKQALALYEKLRDGGKSPLKPEVLAGKIAALEILTRTAGDVALQKMRRSVADATRVLNQLFGLNLADPPLELIPDEKRNAYWDGTRIDAPSLVQDIPDIIYHEVAWPFIETKWRFRYEGQTGALVQSYTDVLATLVKQTLLKQNAKSADWTIGPGAVAWITGKPGEIATDRRPLRSLKAPGTAYDDPTLGKDPQADHFGKLVKLPNTPESDLGGVHTNSGIPNRAFYETAIQIGSDKAGAIWIASLARFNETTDLRKAAQLIYKTAVDLHGEGSAEAKAVKAGWNTVGLSL